MNIDKEFIEKKLYYEKKTIQQIADEIGIKRHNLYSKIKKLGISNININKNNVLGEKFNFLTPIEFYGTDSWNKALWKCKCDCGNETIVSGTGLTHGKPKSCGCYRKDIASKNKWKGYGEIGMDFFSHIKRGAKSRNLEFTITIEEIWDLFLKQDRKCYLSGKTLYLKSKRSRNICTASLDRIDSSKGYTIENVQWIDAKINIMKHTGTNEEFINLCNIVSKIHPR